MDVIKINLYDATKENGYIEFTPQEWDELMGNSPNTIYGIKVYEGAMSIDDVPEENRAVVESLVANKIAKWGEYKEQDISAEEFGEMLKGAL